MVFERGALGQRALARQTRTESTGGCTYYKCHTMMAGAFHGLQAQYGLALLCDTRLSLQNVWEGRAFPTPRALTILKGLVLGER